MTSQELAEQLQVTKEWFDRSSRCLTEADSNFRPEAKAMTAAIVAALAQADPGNAAAYRVNGARLAGKHSGVLERFENAVGILRCRLFVLFYKLGSDHQSLSSNIADDRIFVL